jgi:hypothetical protein
MLVPRYGNSGRGVQYSDSKNSPPRCIQRSK